MMSRGTHAIVIVGGEFVLLFVAGFIGSRRNKAFMLLLAILAGVPLGFWIDSFSDEGP